MAQAVRSMHGRQARRSGVMVRVLVTGGAGYIGSVTVAALVARGDEVTVLDSLWRGHRAALDPDATFIEADLRDPAAVTRIMGEVEPDAVIHFAGATLVPESVREPLLYYGINVGGSTNVLQAAVDASVDRFVFSSTAAVYGTPETSPVPEDAPLKPINPYGASKLMVEQMLADASHAHGLRYAALRYFNVAGATATLGEDHDPETHVVPVALQVALGQRDAFAIYGTDYPTPDGTAVRDYVHVVDLAAAHIAALDRLHDTLGAVNIGTRAGVSVRELVHAVERVTKRSLRVREEPRREGDPPMLVADARKAHDVLGWEPRHSTIDEMVSSAWEWMQRNPRGYGR